MGIDMRWDAILDILSGPSRRRSLHRKTRVALSRLAAAVLLLTGSVALATTYQTPQNFLKAAFGGTAPAPRVLWLTGDIRAEMKRVLGKDIPAARIRYWRRGKRTAWVLDEIGKEAPITTGIVINDGRIETIDVLVYRENRGGEVRLPYFRRQFIDAMLTRNGELDRSIDGISGATLSVRAMRVMARRALFLHSQVMAEGRR